LGRLDVEAERVAVKSERGVEILDGNADVIENGPHKNQAISDFRLQISDWRSLKIADCRLPITDSYAHFRFKFGAFERNLAILILQSQSVIRNLNSEISREAPPHQLPGRRVRIERALRNAIDHRSQLTRRQHAMLEMIHELVRHELAEAVLAARPCPGGLRAFGVIAKTPDCID